MVPNLLIFSFQVFGGFGRVVDVELSDSDECAYITFHDFFEAWFAQQSLNGYYVADYRVNLLVKWLPNAHQQGPTQSQNSNERTQQPVDTTNQMQRSGSGSFEQMSTNKPEF